MPREDLRLWVAGLLVWSLLVCLLFSRPCAMIWLGSARGTDICCRLSRWLLPNAFEVSHDFCIDSVKRSRRPSLGRARARLFSEPYLRYHWISSCEAGVPSPSVLPIYLICLSK